MAQAGDPDSGAAGAMTTTTPQTAPKLAVIGGGKMGGAITARVVETGLLPPQRVVVSDLVETIRTDLSSRLGVQAVSDNRLAVDGASCIVLAVTPQVLPAVLDGLQGQLRPEQIVVSIAAGVTIETLVGGLGHPAVIRVMPNILAQVAQGISAWFAAPAVAASQKAEARAVLQSVGREFEVDREPALDMVTAVSGSGPAWVMLMVEAMIDAAVQIGLRPDWARELVYQTMSGSITLARETGKHPAELRNQVTTPGGTTAAGLYEMERAGLRAAVAGGIVAAYRHSLALGAAARQR
jgi:pyrroline-5-carboxylate reductase